MDELSTYFKKRKLLIIAILVLPGLITEGYVLYTKDALPSLPKIPSFSLPTFQKPTPRLSEVKSANTTNEIAKKNKEIVNTAEKQIALPDDEEPIMATVTDRESVKNQEFFQDAQNGDKILLYPKNKKAFLYRPSLNRVLVQAPLQYGEPTATPSASVADTSSPAPLNLPPVTYIPHGKVLVKPQ